MYSKSIFRFLNLKSIVNILLINKNIANKKCIDSNMAKHFFLLGNITFYYKKRP